MESVNFHHIPTSYWKFIIKDRTNQEYLIWALALSVFQFVIFKMLYPYPDFFSDSYWYIFAAAKHLNVNAWPIGYSKFLAIVHLMTYSDTVLTAIQYFFLQAITMHFYFSLLYFQRTTRLTRILLFVFFFLNPITLYFCNSIGSDSMFASFSLLWFVDLVWLLKRPKIYHLYTQSLLFVVCLTLRNTAYYYPLITTLAFLISPQPAWRKLTGICFPIFLAIPYVLYTKAEAYKMTGQTQFSLFTGWQLANNALYIYGHIAVDSTQLPTSEARTLNRLAAAFYLQSDSAKNLFFNSPYEGNKFISLPESPLKQYFATYYRYNTDLDIIRSWGRASYAFVPFGRSIIYRHPFAYIHYFVWPNLGNYLLPPLSNLARYNGGHHLIPDLAQSWFHFPQKKVSVTSFSLQSFLEIYPFIFLMINIFFFMQLAIGIAQQKWSFHSLTSQEIYVILASYWLANLTFSVFITINIFRYQYTPMLILFAASLLMSQHVIEKPVKESFSE